ncbi:MAG: NUDIX hydrolase [Planctomycetales bacterium]|nr:NUDIX hydrolase [Planctomycetales bacterium]
MSPPPNDEPPIPQVLHQADRFQVVQMHQRIPDGSSVARQIVLHPGAVAIIPVLDDGRICLIRNFRIAVGKTLLELPAGTLDRPEPPSQTARRELAEETGYLADRWRELPGFFMSPGILRERMHVFVAEGLREGPPHREAGEEIANHLVQADEALSMATDGRIEDAKTIAALLMWDRLGRS